MDYVEDRFRRFHDFPEQGRRDFYHPHFQEFHRFDDFVDHRHPKGEIPQSHSNMRVESRRSHWLMKLLSGQFEI